MKLQNYLSLQNSPCVLKEFNSLNIPTQGRGLFPSRIKQITYYKTSDILNSCNFSELKESAIDSHADPNYFVRIYAK